MNEIQRIIDNCAERGVPAPQSYAVTEYDLPRVALVLGCSEQELRAGWVAFNGVRICVWPQL